ncbi:hypothetical protein AB0764_26930 (plasmid) [Priestia megaterium]|uniref:hypothetical protein n=1 Tax=Priestia megaterium TaxID=1404 RepID=UPI0038781623
MNDITILIDQLKDQYLLIIIILSLIPTIYAINFSNREDDERGEKITSKAYQMTYFFFLAAIFAVFIYNSFSNVAFKNFRTLIMISLFLSNFFLGSTIFILNKKY